MYKTQIRIPNEYAEHVKKQAFAISTPENIISFNQYVNMLIKKDMEEKEK